MLSQSKMIKKFKHREETQMSGILELTSSEFFRSLPKERKIKIESGKSPVEVMRSLMEAYRILSSSDSLQAPIALTKSEPSKDYENQQISTLKATIEALQSEITDIKNLNNEYDQIKQENHRLKIIKDDYEIQTT